MAAEGKPEALQDVMLAMDVVDTLRHADRLVDRELDSAGRRERLIERLRKIYKAQGIEVSDEILREGVVALEEERFAYRRAGSGVSRWLARIYISRGRWFKPLAFLLAIALFIQLAVSSFNGALFNGAPLLSQNALPVELRKVYVELNGLADLSDAAHEYQNRAEAIYFRGTSALEQGDRKAAKAALEELEALRDGVMSSYSLRVVNEPGARSGVFRIPDVNPDARNYYLIVEPIDALGRPVAVDVLNEEDGQHYRVKRYGLRVSEAVFQAIAADKQDDGIIQNNIVARKAQGRLQPDFLIDTTGDAITRW